jgi:hypothetical protein
VANLTKEEKTALQARLEKLKGEIQRIKKEGQQILDLKNKGTKFEKLPAEENEVRKKISSELLQRENEMFKIHFLLNKDQGKEEAGLMEVKALMEEKGLKQKVQGMFKKETLGMAYLYSDCVTNCTDCVWCDTNCVTSCTSCVTCISDEMLGNVPLPGGGKK